MGQSPSSLRSKSGRQRSFRGFARRSKLNNSSLSHTFSLPPSEDNTELMNINTATEEQLMTLPGVNRQLAKGIVKHRQLIGRFKRVDDLALVSGIGAEKLELLRPEICTRKALSRASSCTQSLDSVRVPDNRICSVNSASVFQLQCIPGLNQELAANIVDYRNKKGPFKLLDDLIKVRGIDIVRLSTVKQHLNLELRKCDSVQQLTNTSVNRWSSFNGSVQNGVSSTPKSSHKKSLSMPSRLPVTLPNGFATAPVNDILDLLSAYSHRPIIEDEFQYERNGLRCCRLASWNLSQLSVDKINNPGVREVVCRTILEHKLSLIAVQEVLDVSALRIICEELNSPHLRRVCEWKCNSQKWEYCVSEHEDSRTLGFVYDTSSRANISIGDMDSDQLMLFTDDPGSGSRLIEELGKLQDGFGRHRVAHQAFLVAGRPLLAVNLQCQGQLDDEECLRLRKISSLTENTNVQLALMGDFYSWDNIEWLQKDYHNLIGDEVQTNLDPNAMAQSNLLCIKEFEKTNFNLHSGAIRSGLSHLAIPRGWSWGGPASPHCPVFAEFNVPD